jgi:tripartite-type tricarboxylate transporter receptor subunit TctC
MKFLYAPLLAAALAAGSFTSAQAQPAQPAWPAQSVRIVVPYTAGGPADVLARVLGQQLSQKWGQPVVIDNKPGANEMIAAQEVSRAPGDGYTLLMASDAVFSLNQHLYSKIAYEPLDFVPVTKLVTANLMLVARPDLPVSTLKEFVDYAARNPNRLNYASVGLGGVNHLGMAWFNSVNNLQMQHVPYKGLPQALQDLSTSRVDVGFAVMGGAVPLVNAGKLKALAVSGKSRAGIAPSVPTFAEAGYPQFDASFYFAIAAPKGTPAAVARKFAQDATGIINSAEFKAKQLTALGFDPVGDTPEQFTAFLVNDRALAEKKVKVSGAKLD